MTTKQHWDDWFAGVVDGDGYFYINKKKEISFELTMATRDCGVLYSIKDEFKAGSIKSRSGSKSMRYRIKSKSVIERIVHKLNGKLHNPTRLEQFSKVCELVHISLKPSPQTVCKNNAYLSGLVDSDGTINISISKSTAENSQKSGQAGKIVRFAESRDFHQLTLKVTSIHDRQVIFIQNSYELGKIYRQRKNLKNRQPKDQYIWVVANYEEFIWLFEYFKKYPLKSAKMHRIRLCLKYFYYKQLKFHLKPKDSLEYKMWVTFCTSWFKYNF